MPPRKPRDDDPDDLPPDALRPSSDESTGTNPRPLVLVRNVVVDGKTYGPGSPENGVTAEVAAQITNPAAWGE